MALGNTDAQLNGKLYVLKIKTKALDKETGKEAVVMPHVFQVSEKVNDKWTAQPDTITTFSGDLTRISFDEGEWEGDKYNIIKLMFSDPETEENYLLDARCSSDLRSLANSIMALDPLNTKDLKIQMYKGVSKKNGKTYSNIGLRQKDGSEYALIKGKYAWEEMPEVKMVKFKGKDMPDTFELDAWVLEKLAEFAKAMEGGETEAPTQQKTPRGKTKAKEKDELEPAGIVAGDDVDF